MGTLCGTYAARRSAVSSVRELVSGAKSALGHWGDHLVAINADSAKPFSVVIAAVEAELAAQEKCAHGEGYDTKTAKAGSRYETDFCSDCGERLEAKR